MFIRRIPWLTPSEVALAIGFAVAGGMEAIARHWNQPALLAIHLPGAFLLFCVTLRRRRPLLAIAILTAGAALGTLLEVWFALPRAGPDDALIPIFATLFLIYSLGAYGSTRELAIGAALPLLLVLAIDLSRPTGNSLPGALIFFAIFIIGSPGFAGRLIRLRRSAIRELQAQERRIGDEQAAQARSALTLDRVRIADRLHDSLLSGIESLAVGAHEAVQGAGPRQGEVVAAIESEARSLLSETRRVVVSLASDEAPPAEARAPETRRVETSSFAPTSIASLQPWFVVAGAAVCIGLMFETRTSSALDVALPIALLACFAVGLPIAILWVRPLLLISLLWAAASLFATLITPLDPMFTAIALSFLPPFGVACFARKKPALIGLGVCCLGELAVFGLNALPTNALFVIAAWAAGRIVQDSTRLISNLRSNRARLDEQHEAQLSRAMLEQRARFARDLHDSVGHALTVVALQAGAARRLWSSDRTRAVDALTTIERVANTALAELQQPMETTTTLGLDDIDQLLQSARAAGLNIDLESDSREVSLSPAAQLAAYRLVQEALTNVLKHAPGAAAKVTVATDPSHVELCVANGEGRRNSNHDLGGGHGLRGMKQRVESCGGRLSWGPQPGGGFEVRARFPLHVAAAAN